MQYENKILISAILIIAVALISFSAIGPNISGRVSGFAEDITVSPRYLDCGSSQGSVMVEVAIPESYRIRRDFHLYDAMSGVRYGSSFSLGKGSLHYGGLATVRLSCGLEKGDYFLGFKTRDNKLIKSPTITII